MRLDKYLKVSRLIKRRSVAKEQSDSGKISVNGKVAKPSLEIKLGDIIEITLKEETKRYKITLIREYATEEKAREMYMEMEKK